VCFRLVLELVRLATAGSAFRAEANENPRARRTWCADVAVSVAVSRFGFTPQIVHNQRNTNFIVWSLVGHLTMIFCKCKFHWGRLGYFQRVNLFFAPTLKGRDRPVYMDYWHCLHSMRSRVYESVRRPSVRLSVSLSVCLVPASATAAKFAAVARPEGDPIDRLLHGVQQRGMWRANAGSATLSAYVVAE